MSIVFSDIGVIIDCADLTITTDKLMELFASVEPEKVDYLGGEYVDRLRGVLEPLGLPAYEVDKIKKNYQSPTQRKEAYLDLYVHQHPCPSWQQVAEVLRYTFELHQQADFVEKTYVKGMHTTITSVMQNMLYVYGKPELEKTLSRSR